MPKWSVPGLKTFMGMEGCGGFNLYLLLDGKKVAIVINEDRGGPYLWRWLDKTAEPLVNEEVKNAPPSKFEDGEIPADKDVWLCRILDQYESDRRYRRACKTKTLFRIKDDAEGVYRQVKYRYTPEVKAAIEKKFGDKLVEIINERYPEGK